MPPVLAVLNVSGHALLMYWKCWYGKDASPDKLLLPQEQMIVLDVNGVKQLAPLITWAYVFICQQKQQKVWDWHIKGKSFQKNARS